MGVVRRLVGAIVFLAVVVFGMQIVASESGEVVVLRTFVGGDAQETRLWIVDDAGTSWLRAGQPSAGWYQRVLQNPDVEVERGGQTFEYRAFPVEGGPAAQHVNSLMFDKYGWAEQVIGILIDRSRSVAIRLDPR
jgi:hypothetical protein